MIAILCTLLFVLVHGCAGCAKSQPVWIYAATRKSSSGGAFLKVQPPGGSSQVRDVSFTGYGLTDPKTDFHVEKSNARIKERAFRYREGQNDYYLSAESAGKVQLRKLNDFPSENKYFFSVQRVSSKRYAFKSVETGEYLHSDPHGRASMRAVPSSGLKDNKPQDQYTLFGIIMHSKIEN